MLKSYFKMAWRIIVKNKVSSIVNISGLAVGLGTGIIILLVIVDEFRYDHFNKNIASIRLLMANYEVNGVINTWDETPESLAEGIQNEIPEIKFTTRTRNGGQAIFRNVNKSIYLNSFYADPDFFKMMTFPAIKGNPAAALNDPGSVVVTENSAHKLFGDKDPIGKQLLYNNSQNLKVAAVIKDLPQNSTNKFDVVLSFKLSRSANDHADAFTDSRVHTWIQLNPGVNEQVIDNKLTSLFRRIRNEKNISLFALPFAKVNLYSRFENGKPVGGLIDFLLILSCIAIFVLLIACINYMNLATALSEHRAREVGVRKVLGARRIRIIFQFLSEAFILSFLSLVLGIVLAVIFLPGFMRISGKYFTPAYSTWQLWVLLLSLGLVTGIVAGSFPAFYLSRFKPVKVLKKVMLVTKSGGLFRKALVTFQFVISIFMIIGTVVMIKGMNYVESRPIGFDSSNLIDIPVNSEMGYRVDVLKNELLAVNGVKNVTAGSDNLVYFLNSAVNLDWPGKNGAPDIDILSTTVSYDWTKTAGLDMKEGRDFDPQYGLDSLSCLINETAADKMKLKQPIGSMLGKHTVIGVVKDFVYNNPASNIKPLVIYLGNRNLSHLLVRIANNSNWREFVTEIEKVVKHVNPEFPFEFSFTSDNYHQHFKNAHSYETMAKSSGAMAIFISCLGLFGLSAFLAERRKKEVSIRKVLGASVSSLWVLLSKDFLKPVILAFLLAVPLTGWIMGKLLQYSDYHIKLSSWLFIAPGLLVIIVAILTVSYSGIKAAKDNPAKNLGAE
jgi:ABC-type antimicrobial peptide transport system permease subunit